MDIINIKIFTMNNTSCRQIGDNLLPGASPLKSTELWQKQKAISLQQMPFNENVPLFSK